MSQLQSSPEVYAKWEKIKDMIDQLIDIMLNLRQSGHPGGSRSKVHMMVSLFLSGAMRWDIRNPHKRFGDKFILSAGHTVPGIYALLAVFNESLRRKFKETGDSRYELPSEENTLYWEDLLTLRNRGGLPGHAEMAGKTNLFKANTGPSGHGLPLAVGEAMALKYAGADDVRVFAVEGEGGLTPGVAHESLNAAFGLGLSNLHFLVDWNDFGIDDRPYSSVVYGTPEDWFSSHGWRVFGTEDGSEWSSVNTTLLEMEKADPSVDTPAIAWFKTRKGRGYGVYDNKSHGAAHKFNNATYWETKKVFMDKYGIDFDGYNEEGPAEKAAREEQTKINMERVFQVFEKDPDLLDYLADRLVELGNSVPDSVDGLWIDTEKDPMKDPALLKVENLPDYLFVKPGDVAPNRAGFSKYAAWLNGYVNENYGRPLFLATSADLADSTNISGFGKDIDSYKGQGFYERNTNKKGVMLPQPITEFANAGICAGIAATNFARDPESNFNGFFAACSTYGSFSYLKYGAFRIFSQMAQDADIKLGRLLWVAGHSGPETAEDSRTHFGIYAPAVTQLFPKGKVINLYPSEHNEVAPMLTAALATDVPIIALHLTRPGVEIPDRKKLGMASYMDAAKGAYIIRDYKHDMEKMGTIFVQGTASTANIIKLLPELDKRGLNVKLVAAVSPQLFSFQSDEYKEQIVSGADWNNSTFVTNSSAVAMQDWTANSLSSEYAMTSDWDDNWRSGGSLVEVVEEAHLSERWLLEGIERFVNDHDSRMKRLQQI
ncbi:MAG: transketolase [Candidatus Marinimicrobia bacterium]|nr:transketolase [Candidatus Neomarinimicrobiota bacterium]MCF7850460.1 transketolase [Candidatus Neomarinimicrobiota bacterium]MCF7905189.1 transketolase [Candidatus Neomarinimicrobiota bacterium]